MPRPRRTPRLSAGEIELLQVLWREGGATLIEAQRGLNRPIGYTTVQTRLNRLAAKGLAQRSKDRPAIYRAAIAPEAVSAGDLDTLVDRVSGGQVVPLVAHLVRDRRLSAAEIDELRQLIDAAARRQAKGTRS